MHTRPRVLSICTAAIPSAIVGVIRAMEVLNSEGALEFAFLESHRVSREQLVQVDILICIRGADDLELEIVKFAKSNGCLVIYFLDDDLLNVPTMCKYSHQFFSSSKVQQNIIDTLSMADILLSPNRNILEKYRRYCSDGRHSSVPALLLDSNRSPYDEENRPLVIGFSGGIDHELPVESFLLEPIRTVSSRFGENVRFEVMGPRPEFLGRLGVRHIPYEQDFGKYVQRMKSLKWDIGLAPLFKSEFHSCKFFNKYLEYGSIMAAGIYSKAEPYTWVVENRVNGILVDDGPEEWVNAMTLLIEDSLLRSRISEYAFNHICDEFALQKVSQKILKQIPELSEYRAPLRREGDLTIGEARHSLARRIVLRRRSSVHRFL